MKLVFCPALLHIDFCDSIYEGLPNSEFHQLQLIRNSATRLVVGMARFYIQLITSIYIKLHIFSFKPRMKFKLCLLVSAVISQGVDPGSRFFKGFEKWHKRPIGRTFCSPNCNRCSPRIFKSLPNVDCFKGMLKTFFIKKTYNLT